MGGLYETKKRKRWSGFWENLFVKCKKYELGVNRGRGGIGEKKYRLRGSVFSRLEGVCVSSGFFGGKW